MDDQRGRNANAPGDIPPRGLRDVFWRVISEISGDRVTLIAAGVTYYMLLSLFPALGALVSLYGFVADPTMIAEHIGFLADVFPTGSLDIILGQLKALTDQKTSTLSMGFVTGLLVALWSANNSMTAIFDAMNIAYGEIEKRSFLRLMLLSFAFTIGAIFVAIALIVAIGVLPAILSYLWLDQWVETLSRVARWPFLLAIMGAGVELIYRYGPSREPAKLRWLSWGAVFSTLMWLAASLGFSYYIDNFASYNATYGTLGVLIGFMVWIWITVIILIVGAELNAELEHQTMRDSTTGASMPLGKRGAYVADTIGKPVD